jgi:hypothetical protein
MLTLPDVFRKVPKSRAPPSAFLDLSLISITIIEAISAIEAPTTAAMATSTVEAFEFCRTVVVFTRVVVTKTVEIDVDIDVDVVVDVAVWEVAFVAADSAERTRMTKTIEAQRLFFPCLMVSV